MDSGKKSPPKMTPSGCMSSTGGGVAPARGTQLDDRLGIARHRSRGVDQLSTSFSAAPMFLWRANHFSPRSNAGPNIYIYAQTHRPLSDRRRCSFAHRAEAVAGIMSRAVKFLTRTVWAEDYPWDKKDQKRRGSFQW